MSFLQYLQFTSNDDDAALGLIIAGDAVDEFRGGRQSGWFTSSREGLGTLALPPTTQQYGVVKKLGSHCSLIYYVVEGLKCFCLEYGQEYGLVETVGVCGLNPHTPT